MGRNSESQPPRVSDRWKKLGPNHIRPHLPAIHTYIHTNNVRKRALDRASRKADRVRDRGTRWHIHPHTFICTHEYPYASTHIHMRPRIYPYSPTYIHMHPLIHNDAHTHKFAYQQTRTHEQPTQTHTRTPALVVVCAKLLQGRIYGTPTPTH